MGRQALCCPSALLGVEAGAVRDPAAVVRELVPAQLVLYPLVVLGVVVRESAVVVALAVRHPLGALGAVVLLVDRHPLALPGAEA